MTKRKIMRRSNRPFIYNPHYYNWGGDFKNALGGTNLKGTFSGGNVAGMLKGGLASGIGSAVGNIAGGAISGGLESGAGSAISNIGGTIGGAVSAVNPVLGGIISAGTGIIGGLTNRMFGSKLNKEKIAEVEGTNKAMNTVMVDNSSADSIEDQWANQDFGADFSKSDIGKDGLFSSKAKKKYRALKKQQGIARERALSAFENATEAADTQSDLNAMANFAAFGGPLGYGSEAIGYELAKENLGIKALNAANKGRLTSLPNSFESPELNTFAKGGKIHIKPSKRGTFTAAAKRHGKSVQSFASQVLANKENYSPAMVKKANFARNAAKWHSFGGDLNTHGADFTNGQIIVGNGGTHEENPMEGVPMGMDAEGSPNLVEQGEVIFNDYVFSNRLFADGGLLESFNLPKSYNGHSFAAIAEKLGDESKERPNDPISKRGLLSSMSRLQQAQETVRQQTQEGQETVRQQTQEGQETVRQQTQEGQEGVQYAHGGKMGTLFDGLGNESNNLKRANFFLEPTEDNHSYNPFIDMAYTDPDKNTGVGNKSNNMAYTDPDKNTYDIYKYGVGITPNGEFVETPKYMARAAAKRAGYDVGTSLDDYNKNPIKVPEKKKSAVSRLLSNLDATDLRYAPVIGAAIGLGQNLFSRPDYTSADAILEAANQAGNYTPIGYTPIGNYLQYKPFDRNFYLNKLNAQAGATRRAIMNTTSPSRNAALLAVDYNTQGRLGDLARQAEEYNLAQRQAVETFNRGTNQANAEMGLKAAMLNQEAALRARNSRLIGVAQAMTVRDAVDARRGASMSANLTNFFNSLGDIGREEYSRNMIMSNPALYYSIDSKGNVTYKNGYETLSEAEKKEVRDAANKAKKKKKAKGGYLTIKKK